MTEPNNDSGAGEFCEPIQKYHKSRKWSLDNMSDQNVSKVELWSKIAAVLLGIFTLMIPISISMIRATASEYITSLNNLGAKFETYQLTTERRIVLLEERQFQASERIGRNETILNNQLVRKSDGIPR